MLLGNIRYYYREMTLLPVKQHLRCLLLLPSSRPSPAPSLILAMDISMAQGADPAENCLLGFFPRWISHWISCLIWPAEHQGLVPGRQDRAGCRAQRHRFVISLSSGYRADTPTGVCARKSQQGPVPAQGYPGVLHKAILAQLSPCPGLPKG